MEEKELKTSKGQRIGITAIAVVMLGSIIAGYAAIVASGASSSSSSATASDSEISDEKLAEYESDYADKLAKFQKTTASDFETFIAYKKEIKAYNETAANEGDLESVDLLDGTGRELTKGDSDYLAYYVGWCADETIFDSSLDDTSSPTAFTKALNASVGMIEGWETGIIGMKLGGVRVMTVPGDLAYGETREICGGYNKPLKFMVMTVANEEPLKTLSSELDTAYLKVQYGRYGIDYDTLSS